MSDSPHTVKTAEVSEFLTSSTIKGEKPSASSSKKNSNGCFRNEESSRDRNVSNHKVTSTSYHSREESPSYCNDKPSKSYQKSNDRYKEGMYWGASRAVLYNFFIQCERIFALKIILLLTLDKRTSKWSKSSQHRSTSNSDRHSGRHRSKSPYASKSSGYSKHNRTERSRDYSFKSR